MKVAVIYTGQTRTISKTIDYFKKNVLIDNNVHVFAIIQNDNMDIENWLKEKIGSHLKSLTLFQRECMEFRALQQNLLSIMNITDDWKRYLQTSGSMIEYYQFYLGYLKMVQHERLTNSKYDIVIRMRCDVVITEQMNFNFDMSLEEIAQRCENIRASISEPTIISTKVLTILLHTLYYADRYKGEIQYNQLTVSKEYQQLFQTSDPTTFVSNVQNYIQQGKFILTLRENVTYLLKRKYASYIFSLGVTYGSYHEFMQDYWFNAESQLREICLLHDIDIFNSGSDAEIKSLYEYAEQNYFDENLKLKSQPNVFFFIRRH